MDGDSILMLAKSRQAEIRAALDHDWSGRQAAALVPTVRDVTFDLLRGLEMTTVFGNPGSTEEPFLTEFPDDFRYILGLHEAAVVAMADGFAQASGNAAFAISTPRRESATGWARCLQPGTTGRRW